MSEAKYPLPHLICDRIAVSQRPAASAEDSMPAHRSRGVLTAPVQPGQWLLQQLPGVLRGRAGRWGVPGASRSLGGERGALGRLLWGA